MPFGAVSTGELEGSLAAPESGVLKATLVASAPLLRAVTCQSRMKNPPPSRTNTTVKQRKGLSQARTRHPAAARLARDLRLTSAEVFGPLRERPELRAPGPEPQPTGVHQDGHVIRPDDVLLALHLRQSAPSVGRGV